MPDVSVLALPFLDPGQGRRHLVVPEGATLAEMVGRALPEAKRQQLRRLRVTIADHVIPREHWRRVRPKAGHLVVVRLVPGDGALRSVLTIAVAAAAIAISAGAAAPLLGAGFAAGSTGAGLLGAAVSIGGLLAINALIPVRQDKDERKASPSYSIAGARNALNPDGVVPAVLGKIRAAPPFAAFGHTEVIGSERYFVGLFLFGYGPIKVSNLRIGDTPIDSFQDVQVEIREGYASDEPFTLYPRQVIEEPLSVHLGGGLDRGQALPGPQARMVARDCTDANVDVTFPQGLIWIDNKGKKKPCPAGIAVRYRALGASNWTLSEHEVVVDARQDPFTRTFHIAFPTRGTYEVQVERTNTVEVEGNVLDRTEWTALRGFRPEYPIAFNRPVAGVAVRIRATGQLNGTLDQVNADLSSIAPDWDHATGTWITRETSNPASLLRLVWQGPQAVQPKADDELDLSDRDGGLVDFHDHCRFNGLSYNRYHDFDASQPEVLADVAAAGRATVHDRGDLWGVVIDRPRTEVIAHLSPRVSWEFQGTPIYGRFPDAFRVSFFDETNGYQKAERIVPWPGFVGSPQIVEDLALPGKTHPDEIWIEARKRQHELIHRACTYAVSQDVEHLELARGDLARLSHDVLDADQVSGRVLAVTGNLVHLDETVRMAKGGSYACRFRIVPETEGGAGEAPAASVLRTVRTRPGETDAIELVGPGPVPKPGDLFQFGAATRETIEVIVKGVEAAKGFTARLTLVDHGRAIFEALAQETPPAWDGRVGEIKPDATVAPTAPAIVSVLSGEEAGAGLSGAVPVLVRLEPGAANAPPLRSYRVRHRLVGATTWPAPVTVSAGAASAVLTAYAVGQEIEIQAAAVSVSGLVGPYGDSVFHLVGAVDVAPAIATCPLGRYPIGAGFRPFVI